MGPGEPEWCTPEVWRTVRFRASGTAFGEEGFTSSV